MNVLSKTLSLMLIFFLPISCSVISKQVRTESMRPVSFKLLDKETDRYIGNVVTLGGYILETKNLADESIMMILQAPLGFREEPKSKDQSEGRFIVSQKGFLDPEVYKKDLKITVAGKIVGSELEEVDGYSHAFLKVESHEIYLWPEYQHINRYLYDDSWCDPFPYYWFRYRPYYWSRYDHDYCW
jgi:outer membrane lipoprotein